MSTHRTTVRITTRNERARKEFEEILETLVANNAANLGAVIEKPVELRGGPKALAWLLRPFDESRALGGRGGCL